MSGRGDSNARPLRPERSALPTALLPAEFADFLSNSSAKLHKILIITIFFTKNFVSLIKIPTFAPANARKRLQKEIIGAIAQ